MPTMTTAAVRPGTSQRAMVYTLTGLLGLMGLAMAMAFKDPCASLTDPFQRAMCKPTLGDHLPGMHAIGAMLAVQVAMAFCYELRWLLRVYGVGVVGAGLIAMGIGVLTEGLPLPLVFACVIGGGILVACAVGIYKEQRGAWAIASTICGTLALVFFFGSARVQSTLETSLAVAILPSMALFLPLTVALATTAPGTPRS